MPSPACCRWQHRPAQRRKRRSTKPLDRWAEDFKASCQAANGWGILARDLLNGRLYNVASDLHEIGVLWLGQPFVVCDVYERAFYVDYQNRKQEYVNKFLQFLDWSEVDHRWQVLRS